MDITRKDQFQQWMWDQHRRQDLIRAKHDPKYVGKFVWSKYYSVVGHEVVEDVLKFIDSGIGEIFMYHNTIHKSLNFEVVPSANFIGFAASGCTGSYLVQEVKGMDRMFCANGSATGLHAYGENSDRIFTLEQKKVLINKVKLTNY